MKGATIAAAAVTMAFLTSPSSGFVALPAGRLSLSRPCQGSLASSPHSRGGTRARLAFSMSGGGGAPTFVILPGFGNADVDYVNPFGQGEEMSFQRALENRGLQVRIMPLKRTDWFNVLWGLFSLSFWLGKCTPYEPGYGWYVQRARDTIKSAAAEAEGNGVVVVGHSAGGWLGRAVVGDTEWIQGDGAASDMIKALVTLGAPHFPPDTASYPDAKDMTQGALTYTHATFPGAHVKQYGIACVSVASGAIKGVKEAEPGTPMRSAWGSYKMVCGKGDVTGDGVVPLESAHLEGAAQVTLPAYHSISPVNDPYGKVRGSWYGSDDMVDAWLSQVWEAVGIAAPAKTAKTAGRV